MVVPSRSTKRPTASPLLRLGLVLAQNSAASKKHYKLGRIVCAVIFFLLLLAIATAAEALDWVEDPAKVDEFRRGCARSRHRIHRRGVRLVVAAPRPGPRWRVGTDCCGAMSFAGYAPTGSFFRVTTHLPRSSGRLGSAHQASIGT